MTIRVGHLIKGDDVVNFMEEVKQYYKILRQRIQVDNGTEFVDSVSS